MQLTLHVAVLSAAMGAQGDGGFLRVASALSTLQQGLNHDARQHVSSPTLLHAAQALLQLSTAAVGKAGASDLLPSSPFHDDEHLQQKQQQHTLTKADSTSSSSGAHRQSLSGTGRRSSLRSAADARHRVCRRSVSFKETSLPLEHEQDTLNAAPPAATAPKRAQDSNAAAASAAERTYSDLVLELPGASAALLSQALLGSSSVTLEVDLVMHGGKQHPTAAEPLNSNSDADHRGSSMHQGEGAAFVRTPSGHMVRRTSSSVGLPLSASGKEVWRQDVNDADEELLLQAFAPHMQQLLGLALKYSQQATAPQHAAWSPPSTARLLGRTLPYGLQQQTARCSNFTASVDNIRPAVTLLTPFLADVTDAAGAGESAGQQVLTGGSSGWFDSGSLQASASAVFSPLREWQPLSPTRQGRYQRIFPHQAVAAAQPGLRAVQSAWDVGAAGVTAGRAGGQQLQQEAGAAGQAAWHQQSREVAQLLLQALLVLVKVPRLLASWCADPLVLAAELKAICLAAVGGSSTQPQGWAVTAHHAADVTDVELLGHAVQLVLAVGRAPGGAEVCEQLRRLGLAATVSSAFGALCDTLQLDLLQHLLEAVALLDPADEAAPQVEPSNSPYKASCSYSTICQIESPCSSPEQQPQPSKQVRCTQGSPGSIDARLTWSLRSADSRQPPRGMLALAAEAEAAQQRSTKAVLKTEARLAALMESSITTGSGASLLASLKLFGGHAAAATNIQLVPGSALGTGVEQPVKGKAAGSPQQHAQQGLGVQASVEHKLPGQLSRPCSAPSSRVWSPGSTLSSQASWLGEPSSRQAAGVAGRLGGAHHATGTSPVTHAYGALSVGSSSSLSSSSRLSPQSQLYGSAGRGKAAGGAAALARDKLHSQKLQNILTSAGGPSVQRPLSAAPIQPVVWAPVSLDRPGLSASSSVPCLQYYSTPSSQYLHGVPAARLGAAGYQSGVSAGYLQAATSSLRSAGAGGLSSSSLRQGLGGDGIARGAVSQQWGVRAPDWLLQSAAAAVDGCPCSHVQQQQQHEDGWESCECCGVAMSSCCGCCCSSPVQQQAGTGSHADTQQQHIHTGVDPATSSSQEGSPSAATAVGGIGAANTLQDRRGASKQTSIQERAKPGAALFGGDFVSVQELAAAVL